MAGDFYDGTWMIELAAVGDPTAVPQAVGAVLGIVQQPGMSLASSIASALEGRSRLLIFDNCEHVLDAAADMVQEILDASSTVKVIATSREGLGLAAEQLWPVPPLDVRSSAATLFIETASAVAPAISLGGNEDAISEICHRLDGIPLAIGRIDDAARFVNAARGAIDSGRYDEIPYDFETSVGGFYAAIAEPEKWAGLCRNVIARGGGPHLFARSGLVSALAISDHFDEAREAPQALPAAAEASSNPQQACFALFAYGVARRYSDPPAAYEALSRALRIAQDCGNRQEESYTALSLAWLAVKQAQPADAFDNLVLAIRTRHDAGSFRLMDSPLAIFVMLFDQLGMCEPAATVTAKAVTPLSQLAYPELTAAIDHLREVLGDAEYEELDRAGAGMSNAAIAAYALGQFEHARVHLSTAERR
jgi:hypothetical protein